MAIHRGIQSAIFFYLSCAPCADSRYRKKRRQEALRDQADRNALEEEMPDIYQHPGPSSTNPYWGEDIAQGPTFTRGNKKSRNGKTSREVLSSNVSTMGASSLDLNNMQRGDEQLWGSEGAMDGANSGIQRPHRARTRTRGSSNETTSTSTAASTYSTFRSPPVSDLHPPILRTVHSKEEISWMMQPPPVAEIMSGREVLLARSCATSRQTSTRIARTTSRGSSSQGESPRTMPLDRGPSGASRPPLLSTIASEGKIQTTDDSLSSIDSNQALPSPPVRNRLVRANSDPKKGGVLHGRVFTTARDRSPSSQDPWKTTAENEEVLPVLRPEIYQEWDREEFELEKWVHAHTMRQGIRERWSMDL